MKHYITQLRDDANDATIHPNIERHGGFEHDGVWIEDRTKSPCGRFDLTPEQSDETYGK